MKAITENTWIPLGMVGMIVGISVWAALSANRAGAAYDMALECSQDFKKIDERLSRIEGKLGVLPVSQ